MRRALYVGIDDDEHAPPRDHINDVDEIYQLLATHNDGSPNFVGKKLISPPSLTAWTKLLGTIDGLFRQPADMAVFYFSGHGLNISARDGYLFTTDTGQHQDGIKLEDILSRANKSRVNEIVIILDGHDSGAFAQRSAIGGSEAILREGICILTSSGPTALSFEANGQSIFTKLVCDALRGQAADVLGNVTAASVYNYCAQSLGAWDQKAHFIGHVSNPSSLRVCMPQVPLDILRLITDYFESPDDEYPLDPSYEPDKRDIPEHHAVINWDNERIYSHLQKLQAAHLVEPVGTEHMYYAAIECRSCRLTALGQVYWHHVNRRKL